MFKVRITITGFQGNEESYPCHFGHKVGDEIIYDGETYTGRLCPELWPSVTTKAHALHTAGPRYVEPWHYGPFWYSPLSARDPAKKKYDGLGFKNVYKPQIEPQYHMAYLEIPNPLTEWPLKKSMTEAPDILVSCPDDRTSVTVKLEAFDLSDKGYNIPYFRRQMVILDKVLLKPGIATEKILHEFSREQIYEIYPALSPPIMKSLTTELELIGYLKIKGNKASVTARGKKKLREFKSSLNPEDREALGI
jgi:uncharacterized repeat protein (TIGR04076 family)